MPLAFEFPAEVNQQNRTILENLVRTETDESTRYNIAILLGENLDKFSENENEPSKRIRQKVAEALSVHQSQP